MMKGKSMKIGIIGSGNMGASMGRIWSRSGHQILFSFSKEEAGLRAVAAAAGPNARIGAPLEAAAFGDVVLLAVPWGAVRDALHAAGDLTARIVLTCVNALKPDFSGLAVGTTTSAAEEIARLAPKARVVAAIPPFAQVLAAETRRFGEERPTTFYCGDDVAAKALVAKLLADLDVEAVDAGPLQSARYIEPAGMLMVQLGYGLGMGTGIALKLMRR